mmetsp:Transcript_23280/g.44089  ORF Transcript_23280/g.44089 Transcript_23280/m.44089 type:complete len:105 (+) Transcript_23280:410-724(+)
MMMSVICTWQESHSKPNKIQVHKHHMRNTLVVQPVFSSDFTTAGAEVPATASLAKGHPLPSVCIFSHSSCGSNNVAKSKSISSKLGLWPSISKLFHVMVGSCGS